MICSFELMWLLKIAGAFDKCEVDSTCRDKSACDGNIDLGEQLELFDL